MIEGVDKSPIVHLDMGEARAQPCRKRTWCIELEGHTGACVEVPRGPMPTTDYGPTRKR